MKKFRHKRIIKKYSKEYEMTRSEFNGTIVNGRPSRDVSTYKLLAAFKNIDPNDTQEGSGFLMGDAKFYSIKGQKETPQHGDKFVINGKEYKLDSHNDYDLYPDYHFFIARRVVKDE